MSAWLSAVRAAGWFKPSSGGPVGYRVNFLLALAAALVHSQQPQIELRGEGTESASIRFIQHEHHPAIGQPESRNLATSSLAAVSE